jgi:hypothetical protein
MNSSKKLVTILVVLCSLILGLIVIVSVLTGQGNSIGMLFQYMIPFALLLPFVDTRKSFFMIILLSPFIDLFKRFAILYPSIRENDIAMVLSIPLCLITGMVIKELSDCLFRRGNDGRAFLKQFLLVAIMVMASVVATAYAARVGGIMRATYNAVNSSIYFFLIPIFPRYFTNLKEVLKFFYFVIGLYLIPAIWCIKQGWFGLAGFEIDYLKSGLTIEYRQLFERVMRNMGTMASASALSSSLALLVAFLQFPYFYKKLKFSLFAPFHPVRLILSVIFVVAIYYTYTRTAWFMIVSAILFYWVVKSRTATLLAIVVGVVSMITLYLSAQWIFDQKILNKWQAYLYLKFGGDVAVEQTMVIGTFNGRLESMAGVVSNRGDIWTPFGNLFGTDLSRMKNTKAHDIIAEILLKYGYVPLFIVASILIYALYKFLTTNFRLNRCPERDVGRIFFAMAFGLAFSGFSHGAIMSTFPVNLFLAVYLAIAFHMFGLARAGAVLQSAHVVPMQRNPYQQSTSVRVHA